MSLLRRQHRTEHGRDNRKTGHTYRIIIVHCRPRWSRGNVLNSRSEIREFKPGWGRWLFSGRKNPEQKSSEREFKLGVPSLKFRLVKGPQALKKIGLWAKFNRHIHVLVTSKFGGAQYILKGRSALCSNDHPFNTIQYSTIPKKKTFWEKSV